jgi:hypothetical protein
MGMDPEGKLWWTKKRDGSKYVDLHIADIAGYVEYTPILGQAFWAILM